jgi:hypothetical protein
MARLKIMSRDDAPPAAQPTLDGVTRQLGFTPNFFAVLANSPAVMAINGTLEAGLGKTLDAKTREGIALTTAGVNGCEYCTAAHTYTGHKFAHLSAEDIASAKLGQADDAKLDAALRFARAVAATRGRVSDTDLAEVRDAGYDDGQILEIVANVAKSFLTNMINNVTRTDVDFPAVEGVNAD